MRRRLLTALIGASVAVLGITQVSVGSTTNQEATPAVSLSSCPQSKAEMKRKLDGGDKKNWRVVDREPFFNKVVSWGLDTGSKGDQHVNWPTQGRIEWGGRSDGTGIQYGWSTKDVHRESELSALTYHCLGKRGASNGFPLSQFPRDSRIAAAKLGGNSSNWTQMDGTGGGGWSALANSSNPDGLIHFKQLPFGCLDYATNGQADHTCKGFKPPPRDAGTFWALARRSDYN